ncbi:hypothetical protein PQU99_06300 [Vogesella sp. LYT10W]|nr:hypothetical protein [Vogesella indigofera]MDC7710472.1 hypothetical protein [Vogesella indigofera]
MQIKVINQAHQHRLVLMDGQSLLGLATRCCGRNFHHLVTERRLRSIEKALSGILLHRPQRMLAVFLALVLIEYIEDFASHLARRVVTGLLGDGDNLDAVLVELPLIQAKTECIAEEA